MDTVILTVCALVGALGVGMTMGIFLGGKRPQKARKSRKTSNLVLLVLGLFVLVFIITMIIIFCVTGAVPDTLIQYTLGAGGVEALALSAIKIAKVKCENKEGSE